MYFFKDWMVTRSDFLRFHETASLRFSVSIRGQIWSIILKQQRGHLKHMFREQTICLLYYEFRSLGKAWKLYQSPDQDLNTEHFVLYKCLVTPPTPFKENTLIIFWYVLSNAKVLWSDMTPWQVNGDLISFI